LPSMVLTALTRTPMSTRVFLVVLVATSASQVSGVAGGGLAWASDTTGIQYAQNDDDGSEVVVPPIRNAPGGQPPAPPGNPSVPSGLPPGGVRLPAPQLPMGYGNFCYFNPRDGAFGPIAPIGAPCNVVLPNGALVPGRVGVAGRLPPVLPLPGSQ
jgi:hypothetical protein